MLATHPDLLDTAPLRYLGAFLSFWVSSASFAASAVPPSERPNLIVIMVDDMGYAGVSCFGNPYFQTPQIDRMASAGMRLTDFHSSGTVCSPTRAGLLTGRYQQRAGIEAVIHPAEDHPEHRKGLSTHENTFAELLGEAGYVTGLIGKWHQGYPQNSALYHPRRHGFQEFIGYHSGNIDFVSHVGDHDKHDWWYGEHETREQGYSTHLINEMSLDFVRRHGQADKPFCLYIAHEAIHNPVQVPGDPVRRTEQAWDRWKWQELSTEERIAKYRGMTLPIDEGVGRLLATLEQLGIAENTLVLFFSDNGPATDFPSGSNSLRGGKGSVYEGGHKVPAIAWWPSTIASNGSSNAPLISLDVMPTLLAAAGVEYESRLSARPLDGVNLLPMLTGGQPPEQRNLYWASLANNGQRSEAMRSGAWKLVVQHPGAAPGTFENERCELYNLKDDPSEQHDLAVSDSTRVNAMLSALKRWYAETQEDAPEQPGGWLAMSTDTAPPSSVVTNNETLLQREEDTDSDSLIESITKETIKRNRNGDGVTWFHPRACVVPDAAGVSKLIMNLQVISGSDYFGPVHWMESSDGGKAWSLPEPIPALDRLTVDESALGYSNSQAADLPVLQAGVCDVTPQYHPQTDTVLALGHVVYYRGPKFSRGDQLARYPVYSVRMADGRWSERKILHWDDPRGAFIYSNNCGQRVVMPNGDIMMSFTFGAEAEGRSVAGVRCTFDGDQLRVAEVGPALTSDVGRGLLEPSLTRFKDQFYLTIRAEDGHGYVATSDDGLHYTMHPWCWEDGQSLEMSSTQQHWLTHSDALYLVYTRKAAANENVIRWRAPLWCSRVDPDRLCLIRETERVVLPLVGDGVQNPDAVALMGNFAVTNISPWESIVTVGEWLPRRGARGDLLLSRIRWSQPNRLVQ
ncbi:MAG: sulfatase-like hydrolase/transferase [Planctomycetales bacterium]|nr:sulfatase-like hydrolase/transferase [Planctomycetales bacterium]